MPLAFATGSGLQAHPMSLLRYVTTGSPSAKPLVFLHGLGAGRAQTTSSLSSLENLRLIAPDLPGHGDSVGFDPRWFSFDYFADQVLALVDHLSLDTCCLGGLSMGAGITLNLALRYPDRFDKLILLRPSWLSSPRPSHLRLVAKAGELPEATFRKLSEFQELERENKPVADSIIALYRRPENQVLASMWNDVPFRDLRDLEQIGIPSLVMSSPRDDLHPEKIASTLARNLPNSQLVSLPPRYHEPEAYRRSLLQHISNHLE